MSGTCGEADLHGPLPVPQNLKLGQRHLVGHPHRVGPFVPLIPDISHGVPDCNHKPVAHCSAARTHCSLQPEPHAQTQQQHNQRSVGGEQREFSGTAWAVHYLLIASSEFVDRLVRPNNAPLSRRTLWGRTSYCDYFQLTFLTDCLWGQTTYCGYFTNNFSDRHTSN